MVGFGSGQRRHRFAASVAVGALVAGGAVAMIPAAHAAYPDTFNPFAISGGFTVYAREDGTFGNTETEGSIAVGGTMTKPGDGQYTVVHVVAGTGDYTLPTVDGDPTRVLAGSYSPASGGITSITSAGTSDPALFGDLKLVDRDGPFQAFSRADWLRLGTNPSSPDQTPLIDATHQRFPADATPPSGTVGGGSIYTANTGPTAVADYVEANREAAWDQAASCLADIADPTLPAGHPVAVAENAGDRVVLAPLRDDRPNVVDYADIAGASLVQFSPGPEPGVANPLIIRVPAGTTEVVGARFDPQGAHSPYVMWDLSALTGAVTVTAGGGRMDGSIYAPDADITVDAAPLDGQIIGRDVTTLGGEVHSFLFAGQISCAADEGTFRVRKQLDGIDPSDPLLDRVRFVVNYTATSPGGDVTTGHLVLPADGSWVGPGDDFATGTSIVFDEITPPSIPGYTWGTPTISPNPLVIGAGATADVVVTNAATATTGTFEATKSVVDEQGDPVIATGTVPVTWTARHGTTVVGTGTLDVPLDGTPVSPPDGFPAGTRITFDEDLSSVAPPPGFDWSGAAWNPGRTIVIGAGETAVLELTNLVHPAAAPRALSVVKHTDGVANDPRFQYAISYNIDAPGGGEQRRTRELPVGLPLALDDVETGADVLELAELVPLFDSAPVDVSEWEPPLIRVTADGVTTDYQPAGFEGAVPLADAIVDIPLAETTDLSIEFVNVRDTGTFTVAKDLVGIDASALPPGTTFTVAWTATDPLGEVTTGILSVPADGTPVSPLDHAGEPVQFAYDTVVTFTEQTPPAVDGATWQTPVFAPATLTIGAGDAPVVATTVTNTADVAAGTFAVVKRLVGITADDLLVDAVDVTYVAHLPNGTEQTGSFRISSAGTPTGPTTPDGDPVRFPIGTHIRLAEPAPAGATLPDGFEWALPTWAPSRWVTIDSATAVPEITLTNTAVEYASASLTKLLDDPAGLAGDLTYAVEWWLDGEAQPALALSAGQTVSSNRFPVGSIVEAIEPTVVDPAGGTWDAPVWTMNGEVLPVHSDGRVVAPVSARGDGVIAFTLENRLRPTEPEAPAPEPERPEGALPATGATASSWPLLAGGAGLVLGILLLRLSRRRA